MGVYNTLTTDMQCPRCGQSHEIEVDLYFGFRNMISYRLGDKYQWGAGQSVKKGARPPDGNLDGEGYVECPVCRKDFFVKVAVRSDIIEGVEPDRDRPGHIP